MISVVDLYKNKTVLKLGMRPHNEWSVSEKKKLAKLMCNRSGIDASDKTAMHKEGLITVFDSFIGEYCDLVETDKLFARAVDPLQVTCSKKDCIYNKYI